MQHQIKKTKLNRAPSHRRAMIRNQAITFILHGHLTSTKARVKEVQRFTEKLITLAREGNTFNVRRRVTALLPYDNNALDKLFKEIAPRYVTRPGGYTRVLSLGRRESDTAPIARLEWVM